jgi:hypothetical protein
MLQALAKHKRTNYHLLFTGDESWRFYAYDHRLRWVASRDDVDGIERLSYFHQKTMFTIFSNGTGEYKIAILPEGQKMNSTQHILHRMSAAPFDRNLLSTEQRDT